MPSAASEKTLLLDTASLYFRAFFGVPDSVRAPDGTPVNAVRGLLDFIARLVTDHQPSHLVACWDDDWRPQWRVDLLPSYKSHRVAEEVPGGPDVEEAPDALETQVPLIRAALAALGIAVVGAPGCEADDVIGTLTARSPRPVDVVTGDRDLFQLVDDSRAVRVLYTARGVGRLDIVDEAWVAKKYAIPGRAYADYAVLRGDPSDGLPGVPGVGDKTAAGLISKYADLDGVLAAVEDDSSGLAPGLRLKLRQAGDYLTAARAVVTVLPDAELPEVDATLPSAPADPDGWAQLVRQWGLGGSAERVVAALAQRAG
ncbi:5'-3' exonuclease [Actinopolymorpha singaporensis]|uniref:5'-3' exonuclease n=1 Tax=Actinopolymorpha singaporensis TaxID=117157 RepID=A0A1H1WQC7_9ACTN|nr:5'-3' exonuclease [Actinopolymorpha singaporensis]SDS98566.1 5'-3' exonuclease [Actinopolymorpha singaporensis]